MLSHGNYGNHGSTVELNGSYALPTGITAEMAAVKQVGALSTLNLTATGDRSQQVTDNHSSRRHMTFENGIPNFQGQIKFSAMSHI